jgi:hypothetical protein
MFLKLLACYFETHILWFLDTRECASSCWVQRHWLVSDFRFSQSWDITPCSLLKVKWLSEENAASFLESKSKLSKKPGWKKITNFVVEAKSSSETSIDFQRYTRRYIPEDRIFHVLLVFIHGVHCAGLTDFSVRGASRRHFSRQVAQLFREKFRQ